ncbi:MAG: hypothetical protein ACOYVE_04390 [Melioribacter sp.]|uniref:hypothetical protein n=1 Tax=Melioribacter sp. TaxID=2052167 RepID=UPI003BE96859
MIRKFKLIFPVLIGILLISCNQDPTSVGYDLIKDDATLSFHLFNTDSANVKTNSYTYQRNLQLGISSKLLVGKNDKYEAQALLRYEFSVPDSVITLAQGNNLNISEASIYIKLKYYLGDKSLPFDFTVHRITSYWSTAGFNTDSLDALQYDYRDIAYEKTVDDTSITFKIDPSIVLDWIKYSADSNAAEPNYGILIKPTNNTQRIVGFNAYQLFTDTDLPALTIMYGRNEVTDTLSALPYMDVHAIKGDPVISDNDMVLQGGLFNRGFLYFDLADLPKNIIVNKAELELYIDKLKTIDGVPSSDSIIVKVLADSVEKSYTSDSTITTILSRDGDKFKGDIAWIVQKWVSDTSYTNQGLELYLADEKESLATIWIYGARSVNEGIRPKLKITYLKSR